VGFLTALGGTTMNQVHDCVSEINSIAWRLLRVHEGLMRYDGHEHEHVASAFERT
jgi:hypothetical protein